MAKRKPNPKTVQTDPGLANPFSTGGGGVTFEQRVGAAYLVTLLRAGSARGCDSGKVIQVAFQRRWAGAILDDVVVTSEDRLGRFTLYLQVKHKLTFGDNDLFRKVVAEAWRQFGLGTFKKERDRVGFATAHLTRDATDHVCGLLKAARTTSDADEFKALIAERRVTNEKRRTYLAHFRTALNGSVGKKVNDEQLWAFLRSVAIVPFDFDLEASQAASETLNALQDVLVDRNVETARNALSRLVALVADHAETGGSLTREALVKALGTGFGLTVTGSSESGPRQVDAEFDEIKRLLADHQHADARRRIQRIRDREWGELGTWRQSRLLLLEGDALLAAGNWAEAARKLEEAHEKHPDDEKTQINRAVALELRGRNSEAFALAAELTTAFPASPFAWAVWVRTAPAERSAAELERALPPAVRGDGRVLVPLGFRALQQGDGKLAERLGRGATESVETREWSAAWALLGTALAHCAADAMGNSADEAFREGMGRAKDALDRSVSLAGRENRPDILTQARFDRARIRAALGDVEGAGLDFAVVVDHGPVAGHVHLCYGWFLLRRNRLEEAICRLRESLRLDPTGDGRLFLGIALSRRNGPGDRVEAAGLLAEAAVAPDTTTPEWAVSEAVTLLVSDGRAADALALLDRLPPEAAAPIAIHVLRGRSLLAAGRRDEAVVQARRAREGWTASAEATHSRMLANLLIELGLREELLPVLQSLFDPTVGGPEAHNLIACARELRQYGVVRNACRLLREAGRATHETVELEAHVLQRHAPEAAVGVLSEWLATHADDRRARLQLAVLGVNLGRRELYDIAPECLPAVETASAHEAFLIVVVLRTAGRPREAVDFAYRFVRLHPEDPQAHRAVAFSFLPLGGLDEPQVDRPDRAGPETAVHCSIDGEGQRWVFIEDGPDTKRSLDEYRSDHPLARALLGKAPGDEFTYPAGRIVPRRGRILEVLDKRLRRCQDSMQRLGHEMSEESGFVAMRLPENADPDAVRAEIAAMMIPQWAAEGVAKEEYRDRLMPIHLFGTWTGCTTLDALFRLAAAEDLPIRCWDARREPLPEAVAALRSRRPVVLDMTAIASIALLERPDLVRSIPGELHVSRSAFDALSRKVEEAARGRGNRVALIPVAGELIAKTESPDEARRHHGLLDSVLRVLRERCRVTPVPEVLNQSPSERDFLCRAFGDDGAESIVLAERLGGLLWSDDFTVAAMAAARPGIGRLWTQAVLEVADSDPSSSARKRETMAKMAAFGYDSCVFDLGIVLAAGDMATWNAEAWPLRQVLAILSRPSLDDRLALGVVRGLLAWAEERIVTPAMDAACQSAVAALRPRPNGRRLLDALLTRLPRPTAERILSRRLLLPDGGFASPLITGRGVIEDVWRRTFRSPHSTHL